MAKSKSNEPAFDLNAYAENVASSIPSYLKLKQDAEPAFRKFLAGFRERVREKREVDKKKIIVVLGTGGTFQSKKNPEGRYEPVGSLEESFKALGLPEDPAVHLELCNLMNLDSSQMTVEQWRFLAEMIIHLEQQVSDMYDAVIITHGTDTMAKGAAYLSFMLKGFPKSIIFTGSQEPAVKDGTDAKDQMDRAITTAKIASDPRRRIAEVMVACGLRVTRGTWVTKLGDKTVNAFGPWNQPGQGFDATEWKKAVDNDYLHRLAPALLDFGTGKGRGSLEFAGHAIDVEHKGTFEPFTRIIKPAGIFPATLSDKSPVALATHIIHQRVSVLTQLGSATADDRLVNVALQAAERGKIVLFEAPFHDSTIEAGTYEAGAAVLKVLPNIQRRLPIINTSPSTFEAKANYLLHKLDIRPDARSHAESAGLGVTYESKELRQFYDAMEQSLVKELVSV